jgi:diadenosine tetraphosphatase ApaH/serine/threonine PP2A family protein phosphatase
LQGRIDGWGRDPRPQQQAFGTNAPRQRVSYGIGADIRQRPPRDRPGQTIDTAVHGIRRPAAVRQGPGHQVGGERWQRRGRGNPFGPATVFTVPLGTHAQAV